ncbi:MAG: TetR/AcrR family transcriptional regulator, partial [Actinomycetota bacterium]|nr:TetR/AcrR family transcriptional regulator [Actinomycetota bacterium]
RGPGARPGSGAGRRTVRVPPPAEAVPAAGGTRRRSRRSEAAILQATLELLAERGFAGLSIDATAARAGVGKATIYRHWRSKAQLVIEAVGTLAPAQPEPDTGNLRDDLLVVLTGLVKGLTRSPMAHILPSLVDAAERDAELAELHRAFTAQRRQTLERVLRRAAQRGELAGDADLEVAVDLLAGPVFYRRLVSRAPLTPRFAERVVDAVLPHLTPPG